MVLRSSTARIIGNMISGNRRPSGTETFSMRDNVRRKPTALEFVPAKANQVTG